MIDCWEGLEIELKYKFITQYDACGLLVSAAVNPLEHSIERGDGAMRLLFGSGVQNLPDLAGNLL